MLHVVHAAAPAEGAEDLHVRVLREQIFRQVGPGETGDAGDQCPHRFLSFRNCRSQASVSTRPSSQGSTRRPARSFEAPDVQHRVGRTGRGTGKFRGGDRDHLDRAGPQAGDLDRESVPGDGLPVAGSARFPWPRSGARSSSARASDGVVGGAPLLVRHHPQRQPAGLDQAHHGGDEVGAAGAEEPARAHHQRRGRRRAPGARPASLLWP